LSGCCVVVGTISRSKCSSLYINGGSTFSCWGKGCSIYS
jgi:hypothetical protein